MADITVYAGLIFAGFASIAIPDECTALVAWQGLVQQRPSVKNPA
jgi:glutathione S-transferase